MNIIILNSKIYTMNKKNPKAEAMLIKNGKFEKIGTNEEISKLIDENSQVIDMENKPILPGFNDSHLHFAMLGANLYECNLVGTDSIENLIYKVKKFIDDNKIPAGKWVTGKGWNEDYFSVKKLPTCHDLDKISTEHNICLTRGCYHMCVVNSRALKTININEDNNKIEGGAFDKDINGNLTGICRENAMKYVYAQLPAVSKENIKNYIGLAQDYVLSKGITSVQTDDFMLPGVDWQDVIDAYNEMNNEGKLKVRVYEQCLLPTLKKLKTFVGKGYKTGIGDNHFKIGPIKLLTDGNLGTRTAYMSKPYSDDPAQTGIPQYSQDEMNEIVYYATKSGFQVATHVIGDNAANMVIEAVDKLPEDLKNKDLRCNLIHLQVTDQNMIDKIKKLNIIANIQPIFLNYDIHMAESRLGHDRILWSYNYKTLYNNSLKIAMGSDSPVELPDTVHGIYCAVTRKDLNGYPEGGWYPDEKLSVEEAVRGFTMGSAYASFDEAAKGSVEEGKLADFIVLSDDLFEIEPDKIKDVEVSNTYIDGKLVYAKEN